MPAWRRTDGASQLALGALVACAAFFGGTKRAASAEDQAAVSRAVAAPAAPAAPTPTPTLAGVTLTLDTPRLYGPWTVRVTNSNTSPVRLVADPRLIAFEVTPRSAAKPIRCELPSDMGLTDPYERAIVVPAQGEWSIAVEPRLYCFSGARLDALASGSIVVARLGWDGAGPKGVFVAAPLEGAALEIRGLRVLESPPIALPDEVIPRESPAATDTRDAARLSLTSAGAVDAETPEKIDIPLVLRNDGSRPRLVRFWPEVMSFDVTRPSGVTDTCSWPTLPGAPTRELFTSVPPGGKVELTVVLSAYCGQASFDEGGLFRVRARMDTREASGAAIGLPSFDGQVVAKSLTYVRLHRGRNAAQ